ncbi:MAG: hypothetical protein DHS20C12_11610 [Pseudohongiella sp.]|nr:MAG: hypothetical protein DHS20C12_11610 [Pseudohongiella sp.]
MSENKQAEMCPPEIKRTATFGGKSSRCRFTLRRQWSDHGPFAAVIGCNPSLGDGLKDDPTIRWWIKWFKQAGFRGFVAVNLYPFVSSSPSVCRRLANWEATRDWYARDDILFNLSFVVDESKAADQVFVCWGAIAWDQDWVEYVIDEIQSNESPWPHLWCWGFNHNGAPKHPMARGKHRILANQKALLWRVSV